MSRTIWVNVVAAICLALQDKWGFVIDAQAQAAILIVANVILRAITKEQIVLLLLLLPLSGCAIFSQYGQYDGELSCKGKGSITGSGSASIGGGYGGAGTNAWTIQGDCGDGFSIQRHRERQEVPAPVIPAPAVKP